MAYKDPKNQAFMMKCYNKALSILKKLHEDEFKRILNKLLKHKDALNVEEKN